MIKKIFLLTLLSFIIIFSVMSHTKIVYATNGLDIKSNHAISVDMKTGEIIYSKKADVKAEPASITKLLTALLLDEHKNPSDILLYTEDSLKQPSSSIFVDFSADVKVGDEISASTAMDALLLYSANDIATLIASNISKDLDEFSLLMDKKAKDIGMLNSDFYTPSGLDSDDSLNGNKHYTTAYDLSLLGKEVFKSDWIKETMAKQNTIQLDIKNDTPIVIKNSNNNLNKKGCVGGKTGFTTKAGRCLISFYKRGDREMIGVVLDSPTRPDSFEDMSKLIDYSYSVPKKILYKKGDVITTEKIKFKPILIGPSITKSIDIVATEDITFYDNEINSSIKPKIVLNSISAWDLKNDKTIGSINYEFRNNKLSFPLSTTSSTSDFIKDENVLYLTLFLSVIALLICFGVILRKKFSA